MIELKAVSKSFKKKCVIENCNEVFNKGDTILIKGSNGCGKSTLLKLISKLMVPTSGTIIFDGTLEIGALIENPSFMEKKSLAFNLKYLYNLKHAYDETSVKLLCEQFGLNLESNQPIEEYSIGMRQKAGLIQAIMENQDVVLLDEPTRGFDEASIEVFSKVIGDYIKNGDKIVIIAAHDGAQGISYTRTIDMKC